MIITETYKTSMSTLTAIVTILMTPSTASLILVWPLTNAGDPFDFVVCPVKNLRISEIVNETGMQLM